MVSGKRVRQSREIHAWTQSELGRKVGLSQAAIAQIEGGFKAATSAATSAIAAHTRFPIAFFSSPPLLEIPLSALLFRSHASLMTRTKVRQACRYAEVFYEIFSRLQAHTEPIPLIIPRSQKQPEIAARELRTAFGLDGDAPISHLLNAAERVGVLIFALPINLEARDAFSFCIQNRPVICISADRPGDRLRFNVAHELGHIVLLHHDNPLPQNERDAFRFASELLMPTEAFRRDFPNPVTLSALAELKPKWKVSIQAIIRQGFNASLITERQYHYLFEQLSVKGWRKAEPRNLDVPAEKPRALRKMAELVYGNPLDYASLAADLRLLPDNAKKIMEGYADYASEPTKQLPPNVVSFRRA